MSTIIDMNQLTAANRIHILQGRRVSVDMAGKTILQNVPVRALVAVSTVASEHFQNNPNTWYLNLPANCASHAALKHVLKTTVSVDAIRATEITRVPGAHNFYDNLQVYKAGTVLGMSEYMEHIARFLRVSISQELISYKNLTAMVTTLSTEDPTFKHLANDLARRRFQHTIGTAEDEDEFASYLNKYVDLKEAMAAIDAMHVEARQRAERAAAEARARAQQVFQQKQKTQKEAEAQYKARVNALIKKLNEAKGSVLTLTHEEGELRRELGI